MSDITVTTTEGGVTVVTDTLGAAAAAAAAVVSAAAAATSASNASTSASNAASSASAASTSASNASTSASAASTSASNASSSASAAASSAASAAASAVTEIGAGTNTAAFAAVTLAAIDRTVFAATIVDAFLYDTEKDSDGGAWRKRCSHTSWEAETLSGNWLGSAANEAAARAISGATTGSYYYDTTALGFYTLNAGSGKTETYRGNVRQFPAKVLITVEAARVVLWDLTQAGAPMWMVFIAATGRPLRVASGCVAVSAINGVMCVADGGVVTMYFVSDTSYYRNKFSQEYNRSTLAQRNRTSLDILTGTQTAIVSDAVNDVAMTVLPNAPVDVATGLPVPTIAVATGGGISVIQNDGTVSSQASAGGWLAKKISISRDNTIYSHGGDSAYGGLQVMSVPPYTSIATLGSGTTTAYPQIGALNSGYGAVSTWPYLLGGNNNNSIITGRGIPSTKGLTLLRENPASRGNGMVTYITKDYNSGWQVGAIKGAWLADTVAETLTGTELVTNGTFTTDTTGWTAGAGAALSIDTARLKITNDGTGANAGEALQSFTTVVGKTYVLTLTGTDGSVAGAYKVGTTASGTDVVANALAAGTKLINFVAASTTTHLTVRNNAVTAGGTSFFDNISCRLADVDRSVKAKGLQAFGSLTKAAVASGAALMGYSGFSAANYLEQPYNSDLDFGTGDFCYMGWVNTADVAGPVFCRNDGSTRSVTVGMFTTNNLRLVVGATTVSGSIGIETSTWRFVVAGRLSGVGYLYVDAALIGSGAAADNVTQANAKLNIGHDPSGGWGQLSSTMSLLRASATFPSAEQIKHIYETERPMFEAGAQCCLAGTSNAVTALAYDDETNLLHVGTSYGRSAFKGLVRVSSEATPVGAITALSASAGVIVQGGATAVDVYVPAYTLREELLRDAEQMAKFGQNLIAHDFTATASQEVFTLPVGWEIVAVYQQGTLKRETTAWVRTFDGFKWSVDLVTGATVSDWISILAKRV